MIVIMKSTAAEIIRDARLRAGLTQSELGARAKVSQSVVSAYESASRQPALDTLGKLVEAAGFTVELALLPTATRSPLQERVRQNRRELKRALMRLGASNIRLFGSVSRGDDDTQSDVDLLVDVDASVGLFALGHMRSEAERLLGTAVDIVPANSLKPQVAETVLAEAVAL